MVLCCVGLVYVGLGWVGLGWVGFVCGVVWGGELGCIA